jgi:lipopolysaccharide/colanic/teichoic acid biosynthesis glycosyltransferase
MLTHKDVVVKRSFDIFFSFLGLLIFLIPILILVFISTISFKKIGLFRQVRIGMNGKSFWIYKIRTMGGEVENDTITVDKDPRINRFGGYLRRTKLDEIPQLWNVLIGDMSFVGPRPDVPGYADTLTGHDRLILTVRPGITGPATLKYRNEEQILAGQKDPVQFNDQIIWKDKIEINKDYIKNWTFRNDIRCLIDTLFR